MERLDTGKEVVILAALIKRSVAAGVERGALRAFLNALFDRLPPTWALWRGVGTHDSLGLRQLVRAVREQPNDVSGDRVDHVVRAAVGLYVVVPLANDNV